MMRPKTILTIIILLIAMSHSSSLNAQSLILWHSNGTTTEVELYTQPQVTFEGDKVLILSSVLNMEYDKSDVIRFTYKGKETGIGNQDINLGIEQKDGQIIFHSVNSTDKVAVYKPNGIRVPVQLSFHGSDAVFSLSSIPSCIYMLSVNGRTSKFTKK